LLIFLFAAALAVRLYSLNQPPLDFHAMRQYHSLIIARGYYFDRLVDIPEWQRNVAEISRQRQGVLEPPINEWLVSLGYRAAGGESFWVPHLFSAIYWLVGGWFLFSLARRLIGQVEAVFATAFYLFFPFGILASRSFQPDPMMVMASLAALYTLVRAFEQPSMRSWLLAAIVSSLAVLIKFVGVFWILGSFVAIGLAVEGLRRFASQPRTYVYLCLTLLPAGLFYSYRLFSSKVSLGIAEGNVLPQLWWQFFFWKGWLFQIGEVIGYPALLAALLGVILFRDGLPRALMIGLWAGYSAYGLVFTYAVYIHDYWNLILVPIAALSMAPLAGLIYNELSRARPQALWRLALAGILALGLLLSLGRTLPRMGQRGYGSRIREAEAVGEIVRHSTDTLYLASDYGLSLEYHGQLSGLPWPLTSDLEWERLAGEPVLTADLRFQEWFAPASPRYFIVFDLREFEQQPDLQRFLTRNFAVISQEDHFIVFDLAD
jgi:hypothetical protein